MIKLTQLLKEITIVPSNTMVYKSVPASGLYKVKNFPQGNIDNPQVKKILDKITQDFTGKSFDSVFNTQLQYFTDTINGFQSRKNVYIFISENMVPSVKDALTSFIGVPQTEEELGLTDWKQI